MRRLALVVFFMILAPGLAFAQSSNERKVWGYLFAGPGGASDGEGAFLHVGGGGEGLIYKGLGVGAEIGYFAPVPPFSNGAGLFSVDLSGHFNRSGKAVPFVTGGYSLSIRNGSASGGNIGGGVNYWFSDRAALRVEFRDHIFSSDRAHSYSLRVGVSFR